MVVILRSSHSCHRDIGSPGVESSCHRLLRTVRVVSFSHIGVKIDYGTFTLERPTTGHDVYIYTQRGGLRSSSLCSICQETTLLEFEQLKSKLGKLQGLSWRWRMVEKGTQSGTHASVDRQIKTCIPLLFIDLSVSNYNTRVIQSPDAAVPCEAIENEGERARSSHRKEEKLIAAERVRTAESDARPRRPLERVKFLFSKSRPSARKEISNRKPVQLRSDRRFRRRKHEINIIQERGTSTPYERRMRLFLLQCTTERHAKAEVVGAK
jgi:hypothetical protein